MSEQGGPEEGGAEPQHSLYMLFLLVLVFFAMGLLGFLICHVLKKKGYRCRTFSDELDSEAKDSPTPLQDDESEELNEDTVEKIVKCIIQNEANVEVLKEMLGEGEADLPLPVPVPSSLCPHRGSQDAGLPHHHTVHLGSAQAPCMHCSRRRRRPLQRQGRSREGKGRMHPGETTVFSVGRFHVTHIGKKLASHESQEEPGSKQDLGSADLEHSQEKSQSGGSQNGLVHLDGLWPGQWLQAAPPGGRTPAEAGAEEPARPLDAGPEARVDGPGQEEGPGGSSREEAGLGGLAQRDGSPADPRTGPGRPGETARLSTEADPSENERDPRAAGEGTGSRGSALLHAGPRPDLPRKDATGIGSAGPQGQSCGAQDPGASV